MSGFTHDIQEVVSDYNEEINELQNLLNLSITVPSISRQMLEFRRIRQLQSKNKYERVK